jgi:hypothetical protein
VGDANAEITDRHLIPGLAGIGWDAEEIRRPQVGVAIFNTPEDVVGKGVVQPGADGPAGKIGVVNENAGGSPIGPGRTAS